MTRRIRTRRLLDLGRLLEASGLAERFPADQAAALFAALLALAEALADLPADHPDGFNQTETRRAFAVGEAVRRRHLQDRTTP